MTPEYPRGVLPLERVLTLGYSQAKPNAEPARIPTPSRRFPLASAARFSSARRKLGRLGFVGKTKKMSPSKEYFILNNNKKVSTSHKASGRRGSYADEREITFLFGCVSNLYLFHATARMTWENQRRDRYIEECIIPFKTESFPESRFPLSPRGKLGEAGGAGGDPPPGGPTPAPPTPPPGERGGHGLSSYKANSGRPPSPYANEPAPALINSANDHTAGRRSGGGIGGGEGSGEVNPVPRVMFSPPLPQRSPSTGPTTGPAHQLGWPRPRGRVSTPREEVGKEAERGTLAVCH